MSKRAVVLLVDHCPPRLGTTARILENAHFEVFRTNLVAPAMEKIKQVNPDIVLFESSLPDCGGVKLCRLVRNDPMLDRVFLVGIGENIACKQARALNPNDRPDSVIRNSERSISLARTLEDLLSVKPMTISLRQAYASMRKILALIPDGVLVLNAASLVVYSNSTAEQMLNPNGANLRGPSSCVQLIGMDAPRIDHLLKTTRPKLTGMRVVPIIWEDQTAFLVTLHPCRTPLLRDRTG